MITHEHAIAETIKSLEGKLDGLRRQYEQKRTDSTTAPSRNESRYDTMGVEAAWLADGLSRRVGDMEYTLHQVTGMGIPGKLEEMGLGLIAHMRDLRDQSEAYFLMLPAAGGEEIKLDGQEISIITPDAPIGRLMIGKRAGQVVEMQGRDIKYRIEEIL